MSDLADADLFKPRAHRALPSKKDVTRSVDGRTYAGGVDDELDRLCARVLGTPDGQRVIAYLRNITLNVAFTADVSAQGLMHMEGQRWLVGMLVQRIAKGNAS